VPEQQQLLELIANSREGILAGITRAGYPHMTNVLYVWDPAERIARVSTAFFTQMIEAKRLVVRLRIKRLYGVLMEKPPGA
jgi:Pyridoxamine 5'-phosphate oxidase